MRGCQLVVHCALDFGARGVEHRRSILEGARNVVEVAGQQGVARMVHVSSAAVHGLHPIHSDLPERLVSDRTGIPYCDGKIDAEWEAIRVAADYGLPLVIVRPTVVFGPWGTHDALAVRLLRERRLVLVDGARGRFNGIYIDNLVDALIGALKSRQAPGHIFHLSDDDLITWRQFLEAHARALDESLLPLPEMTREDLLRVWRPRLVTPREPERPMDPGLIMRVRRSKAVVAMFAIPGVQRSWAVLRKAVGVPIASGDLGEPPDSVAGVTAPEPVGEAPLSEYEADMFRIFEQVSFQAGTARDLLGYRPRVSYDVGMDRTAEWIRWAFVHPALGARPSS